MVTAWAAKTRLALANILSPGNNEAAGALELIEMLQLKGCVDIAWSNSLSLRAWNTCRRRRAGALRSPSPAGVGGHAVRIDQEGDGGWRAGRPARPLEPGRFQLLIEDAHLGHVPARPVEAADETDRDRVAATGKRDGDGVGGGLGGARCVPAR